MTKEEKRFLHLRFGQEVAEINQNEGGSSAAGTADASSPNNGGEPPDSH